MSVSTPAAPETSAQPRVGPAISIHDLSYAYKDGRTALNGLSLEVPTGAIFGLLGPNGSGKSTLLSILIGRRQAASGTARVLGEALTPRLRRRTGIVFQEPSLDPTMTVRETMALQGRLFGMPSGEIEATCASLLARIGLADRASANTSTLSGGLKRRLELARALMTGPDVLLLDEPTLALDPDSRLALWQHLLDVNAAGCTLLLATNDVLEAERYCGSVALLSEGALVAQGPPAELKRGLRHDAVRIEWKRDATPPDGIVGWPGVGGVRGASHTTHVTVDDASAFLARLFEGHGDAVASVRIEESTLEDVYFQLVGRGIAAAEGEAAP